MKTTRSTLSPSRVISTPQDEGRCDDILFHTPSCCRKRTSGPGGRGRTINYPVPYSSQGPKSCRSREKGPLWDGEVLIPDRVLPRRWIADLDVWAPRPKAPCSCCCWLLLLFFLLISLATLVAVGDDIRVILGISSYRQLMLWTVDTSTTSRVVIKISHNESPRPATRPVRNSNPGAHDQQKCKERNAIQALQIPP